MHRPTCRVGWQVYLSMVASLLLLSFWSSRSLASRALLSSVHPWIISITPPRCCKQKLPIKKPITPRSHAYHRDNTGQSPTLPELPPAPRPAPPWPAAYRQKEDRLVPPAASAPAPAPACRSRRRREHSTPGSIPAMMTIHEARLRSSVVLSTTRHKPPLPQQRSIDDTRRAPVCNTRAGTRRAGGPQRT